MKKIIVTTSWDDGHVLDLKLAKLLRKYKIAGTIYVSPRNHEFEAKELLSDRQVLALSKDFEIGAHTMTHPDLTELKPSAVKKEISESKKYLEKLIGLKVTAFCYPYGAFNQEVTNLVKKSNLKIARTTKRFETKIPKNTLRLTTTAHVYTHLQDLGNFILLKSFRTIAWNSLAKKEFNKVLQNGGVFHLWGHSWEIEKHDNWEKLEELFKYIGNRKEVLYLTNSELLK